MSRDSTIGLPTLNSLIVEDESEAVIKQKDKSNQQLWEGIKSTLKAATTLKNGANVVFIMAVSTICIQQCSTQINEYFKYATRIQVSHNAPKSPIYLLPGLTVCNNNRLRMENLVQESPILEVRLMKIVNSESWASEAKNKELIKSIKQVVDETINTTSILEKSPISKLMNLSRTSMIKELNCNVLWGREFNCENFRIMESYQGKPCYTLFHAGAMAEAVATGRVYDFNSSLLGGSRKIESFANYEIADIILDFEPMEHADFHYDVGGKFVIHTRAQVGSVRDMAYTMLPGHIYNVMIRRVTTQRLPAPYKSKCIDYRAQNMHEFIDVEGALPSVELDKTTCLRNCIVKQTTQECNCWPVEVPYYPGDTLVSGADQYKLCNWGLQEELVSQDTVLHHKRCYKKFYELCRHSCHSACDTEDHRVQVTTKKWPSTEMFTLASSDAEREELKRLSECCAKISLKYHEFIEDQHKQYPNMTLPQLVSNIGGVISGLVGVSIVFAYRYFTRNILGCKIVGDYMPPDLVPPKAGRVKQSVAACKQISKLAPLVHKMKIKQVDPAEPTS